MEDVNTNVDQTQSEGGEDKTPVSYTEAQVQELLQKETDKRVTSALAKQEYKNKQRINESDKLGQMNESQRQTYEYEQRIKTLEGKEKDFNLMSNKVEAQKVLSSRGLPVEFSDYILAEDADTMMANIKVFEKQFKQAVNDAVSKKIASPSPKTGNTIQTGMTREKFLKLTVAERSNLYNTNPALYKEMQG